VGLRARRGAHEHRPDRRALPGHPARPGYPACPDHTEKGTLFELLEAESRAGIRLTESFAMWPGASVSGYYLWNPASHYFGSGGSVATSWPTTRPERGSPYPRPNDGSARTWPTSESRRAPRGGGRLSGTAGGRRDPGEPLAEPRRR
jgi:hypothetical protein